MVNLKKISQSFAVAATTAVCMVAPTQAEESGLRLTDAWKAALMDVEGVVTVEQHATINSIAYHAAAARLCDGIDLDTDKVATAMNAISTPPDANMEEEHVIERLTNIVMLLGVSKGLYIAEGSMKKDVFCKDAAASKTEEGNEHFFK